MADKGSNKVRNVLLGKPRPRRAVPRRRVRPVLEIVVEIVSTPVFLWGLAIGLVFVVLAGSLIGWTREQAIVAPGMVARETRNARVEFSQTNAQRTEFERETARQNTPRVFAALEARFEQIRAGVLAARPEGVNEGDWAARADALLGILRRNPLLDDDAIRIASEGLARRIELRTGLGAADGIEEAPAGEFVPRDQAIPVESRADAREALTRLASVAGFEEAQVAAVVEAVTTPPEPTFVVDEVVLLARQNAAAALVQTAVERRGPGWQILTRGEKITPAAYEAYRNELREYRVEARWWELWPARLAALAVAAMSVALVAGYIAAFQPRVARRPQRLAWIAGIVLVALAITALGTLLDPNYAVLFMTAPVMLVSMLLVIAYDQRTAAVVGSIAALLAVLTIAAPLSSYGVLVLGIGVAVWRLPEIRDRRTLVSMTMYAAAALALGQLLLGAIDRPTSRPGLVEILGDAGLAGVGGLLAGGITLFVLPVVERAFGIATGMTLIELRDPKHELLKEVQRRAPGTYNHSLNVASIAEAAAEAIGADSLLTYVGALYHDVGKASKPEYFVENQSGGPNRHDKLSPAMSVLVIVGHVKDGLEMAREYRLPKPLHHFIEAHHGTTLVEFFYNRAKKQSSKENGEAEAEPKDGKGRDPKAKEAEGESASRPPAEIDYRYPGPKPKTREVAILMLADAVESTTRTMAEPTPSRIDALVRELAHKRLVDGQFDECDLTFRDLQLIVESIGKSVAAIYHARIQYPAGEKPEPKPKDPPSPAQLAEPKTA
ncbi:MAG: HDIG domain-containing metalloprotein [Planctomycetota bacterium]